MVQTTGNMLPLELQLQCMWMMKNNTANQLTLSPLCMYKKKREELDCGISCVVHSYVGLKREAAK